MMEGAFAIQFLQGDAAVIIMMVGRVDSRCVELLGDQCFSHVLIHSD